MKNYFISFLSLVISFVFSQSAYTQSCNYIWSQQVSGFANVLYTCKAVNDQTGWAAGAVSKVIRTTDGGTTWLNANPNSSFTGEVRNMEAIDALTAWVTTETAGSTAVYKTSNGGLNWVQVYSNATGQIKGIRMLNSTNGIMMGSPLNNFWNILLTTDGGNTWTPSPTRPAANIIHQGVNNCFQVSMPNIYWGTSNMSVMRSTDGGITFSEIDAPGSGNYVIAVRFNESGLGFASGVQMTRSTNAGANYQLQSVPGAGNIDAIESAGNEFWFIRGTKIYKSTNGGDSWNEAYTSPMTLTHMDFTDNTSGCKTGWAVGFGGNIHRMTIVTAAGSNNSSIAEEYLLKQNFPNPFNPETFIEFALPKNGFTSLRVFDAAGNEISLLVNEEMKAGNHSVRFSGENLSSGIYFCTLSSGSFTKTQKMVLIK